MTDSVARRRAARATRERGATAVEYCLIVVLVAAAIFAAVLGFGQQVVALLESGSIPTT